MAGLEGYEAFEYELPESKIAQVPLANRSASKLLHLERESGKIHHRQFRDVVDLLDPGDLLVVNDTTVTAMRLFGARETGGRVELLLLKESMPGTFIAMAKPGRRLPPGERVLLEDGLVAVVTENLADGLKAVQFESQDFRERLTRVGLAPVPPYVKTQLADRARYQTVYHDGSKGGSAAAPTAGLHFTPEMLAALKEKGVQRATVTLDVGLDTFRPITVEDPTSHQIHGETCTVPPETARAIAACTGRIIAVGTTTVRTLETFAVGRRRVESGSTNSRIFLTPGSDFKIIDGMFTNFHMPRTTMLLMISAFASGSKIREAYRAALDHEYRFLSFGDSMLIL